MNAVVDWKQENLAIQHKGRKVNVPISYTTNNYITTPLNEDDFEDEYEDEDDLFEHPIYYSDGLYSSDDEDLEFNPWKEVTSPPLSDWEGSKKGAEDGENPATYLAEVETYHSEPFKPDLHLGPLEYHQQVSFNRILEAYA